MNLIDLHIMYCVTLCSGSLSIIDHDFDCNFTYITLTQEKHFRYFDFIIEKMVLFEKKLM